MRQKIEKHKINEDLKSSESGDEYDDKSDDE